MNRKRISFMVPLTFGHYFTLNKVLLGTILIKSPTKREQGIVDIRIEYPLIRYSIAVFQRL